VFPEFNRNDLSNPATYTAVDLHFTDGTYLSDLKAVDQHGIVVSPQAQGASNTLYTAQWNQRTSRIGEVAKGKTIDRILVGYDKPSGPTTFRAWFDDIKIGSAKKPARNAHLSDYADTRRGTLSSGDFSRGNNFPATAVPHGFNFWTPETDAGSTSWLYQWSRQNNADNRPAIQAFAASHEPSPWMGDRQTFQFMPSPAEGVPDRPGAPVQPRQRDREAVLLRRHIRQRDEDRARADRPRRAVQVRLRQSRRQRHPRQRQQQCRVHHRRGRPGD
jgi:hypothetical protein